ncbi:MAG: 3-coathanger stack domain-containing protein [Thermoanaerobaculia bacterium]
MRRFNGLLTVLCLAAVPLVAANLEVLATAAAVGSFGLDVTLGSTCSSSDNVTIQAPPATIDGDFEACQKLEVIGVEVGTDANFVAGDSITLDAGFAAPAGASFSAVIDGAMPSQFAAITTESPIAEQTFNARFHLRLDGLSLADGEEVEHFRAMAGDGSDVFRVILRRQAGQNLLLLGARQDGGGEILTPSGQEVSLPAGWNLVELDWRAGAGDGQLLVSVNQAAFVGLVDLANSLAEIERVDWGVVDGAFSGLPGRLEVDGFSSWR